MINQHQIECNCGRYFEQVAGETMCRVCRNEERKAWQAQQRENGSEDFSAWYPEDKKR